MRHPSSGTVRFMTKLQFGVLACLLVVIAWVQIFPVLFHQRAAPSWEYRIEGIKDEEFLQELNRIGNAGWEIASARRAISGRGEESEGLYEVIFKRPR